MMLYKTVKKIRKEYGAMSQSQRKG